MPPRDLGNIRTALVVNFHRNESPTPPNTPVLEWIPMTETPTSGQRFLLWFKNNCCCECAGDRNNETPTCRIS